jgi:pimeloyl-ACP methyl ester carboxylesterase
MSQTSSQPFSNGAALLDQFGLAGRGAGWSQLAADLSAQQQSLAELAAKHYQNLNATHGGTARAMADALRQTWSTPLSPMATWQALSDYATDATQRGILFLDIMRQVGNVAVEQMDSTGTPVLVYDWKMVVDGRGLERPVNYALVEILPPDGNPMDPTRRPYIIIDPRAGHGAGIGGFKSDSQVGVALAHNHPVYFVIFFQQPEPNQTLADVTAAEGRFVREVALRHPAAPKPVIIGNCQGGWASMLLAASNPHVTGPIVVNGAPMSYWAGVRGRKQMRYLGGLSGGAVPALLMSDLGGGRFDGAHLVQNFEQMNPGATKWMKYYEVFANADTEGPRFTGFERWWSSFYFLNESEIRWIVENLFIGNRLQYGDARLGGRAPVDLKRIKAPIIVFASHGDDITPPQQALNWIPTVYGDEREIRSRGQRIIYMVHDQVGHLGIFVSAKVAQKEHDRIVSTLEMIESLAPGLYEMRIEKQIGEGLDAHYVMAIEERSVADLRGLDDGADDERPFAVVDRMSRLGVDAYEMFVRPAVKAMVTPALSEALVRTHPLRMRRTVLSDQNPLVRPVAALADTVRAARKPAAPENPFLQTERLLASMVEKTLTFWTDMADARKEWMFYALYANPFLAPLAPPKVTDPNAGFGDPLRELPQVQEALAGMSRGGFAEAVIRMLVLMARSRGAVRQSRLERSNTILNTTSPFRELGDTARSEMIHSQTLIIDFEPELAVSTLPTLLPAPADRRRAIELVELIAGDPAEMAEATIRMLARLRQTLEVPAALPSPDAVPAAPAATEPASPARSAERPASAARRSRTEAEAIGE